MRLQTSTLKLIRDPASKLQSRNLFRDIVTFRPCCSLIVSSNVKVAFTTVDEGLVLSMGVVNWPFQFVKVPTEPHHRRVDPRLKDASHIATMLPGVFWLLAHIDRAMVKGWEGSVIGSEPLQVQEAKQEFLRPRGACGIEAFVEEMCSTTPDAKVATTEAKVLAAFIKYMDATMSKQQAQVAFGQHFEGVIVHGRRICKTKAASRGIYLEVSDR